MPQNMFYLTILVYFKLFYYFLFINFGILKFTLNKNLHVYLQNADTINNFFCQF